MRVSTQVEYAGDARQAVDRVVELEGAGLDIVFVSEAYGWDGPTLMGYLAARTERVQIGSGILPIYSRSPALLAQTAAGLDHLSGGRAILGIGVSGPQVIEGWHGVAYDRPLERTRDVIEICRQVWRREVLSHDGAYRVPLPEGQGTGLGKALKLMTHPERERVPIYLAALGPKNVELAAEVAEGWMPIFFVPERAGSVWGEALARGAERRLPELGPLEVVAGGMVAIGEGTEPLREWARPTLALYLGGMGARGRNFYYDLACRYGYEAEATRVQDLYLAGHREEAERAVPAGLVEGTTLIGPPGYVKERLAAYREAGVTVLSVTLLGPDPARVLAKVREWAEHA
ncbi:MAG: LLM class F420-dependent oxidoreductase [Acidimicrobiales bacterium]|nr:LLM class F420-dependent oxidoreductase [Acidimicrobiales bacterium]